MLNRSLNHVNGGNFYYGGTKPSDSIYINGQTQQPQHHQQLQQQQQESMQHQYAVVKKTGSKRDIRENIERENSAIFKVRFVMINNYTIFASNLSVCVTLLMMECYEKHESTLCNSFFCFLIKFSFSTAIFRVSELMNEMRSC